MATTVTLQPSSRRPTRIMRVSAGEAERQLVLALWLVALLVTATAVTAAVGWFA
jgi:hypothetical protein